MKEISIFIQSMKQCVTYSVGKNAHDNFVMIDIASPHDIWFHIHDMPSGHVIAHVSEYKLNKKQKMDIITQGAVLCKQQSKYKSDKNVDIIYTEVQYIEKTHTIGKVVVANGRKKNI